MKTNTKEFNGRMETYIFECMDDIETYPKNMTETEKLQTLKDRFCTEKGYELNRQNKTVQGVLADWFSGLPTAFNINFYNDDILKVAKYLNKTKSFTEKEKEKIISEWFNFMANKVIQTARKYGVNFLIKTTKREKRTA